ncbi:HmuY protein [Pedobacter steynii]|uniref:HmuY protein n=1 Tax=Pedobacter steynii TaxID=430522 RepID=A0A1H0BK60_9SPHI|nr:HmuY family protein [Pedobacter steynii]NQX41031.1 hypothetical protein [Pedobacter steynii]SDN46030.1 HmuY protein [Pedobacter steynii]
MKNKLKSTIVLFAVICAFASCTKDEVKPEPVDGKSTIIKDLPGDVGKTVGGGAEFDPQYFSFKTGAKVATTEKLTSGWDLVFVKEYNSFVSVNNGKDGNSLGFGGPGKGGMVVINKAYDEVKEAPADTEFAANGITGAGWDSGNGNGWYFYELKTHIAVPIKNRTYVLRTAEGKYAKLEMFSMYKGNPATVSDLKWPAPYFTFRYYVQEDGSRNLNTKD